MLKISGLDSLTQELGEAQQALSDLDGEIGSVSFDPSDPASIENAIKQMENLIDERVGQYANNAIIGPLIGDLKEQYRAGIINQAAEARLKGDS